MTDAERPIGYWLKHLDGLIESTFDKALAEEGLSRRHWQIMNTLKSNPADTTALGEALMPFWKEGEVTLDQALHELIGRGWITRLDGGFYALTSSSDTAHAAVAERVAATRRSLMSGLAPKDYLATVRTLRRMAENLEAPAHA